MCAASDLPEGLALVFNSLLTDRPACIHQLQAENTLKSANRHALIGPVVRGLQLLHDYWAYKGVGTLRREPHEFMAQWDFQASQRNAPIHEMTSLAAFLLLFVAYEDEALQQPDTVIGVNRHKEDSPGLLVPPRRLTLSVAQSCAAHIRIAYKSLHTPFPSWNAQFSALNLHYMHILHVLWLRADAVCGFDLSPRHKRGTMAHGAVCCRGVGFPNVAASILQRLQGKQGHPCPRTAPAHEDPPHLAPRRQVGGAPPGLLEGSADGRAPGHCEVAPA